jgi:membrane associated rhomboid family serine protease
MGDRDYFKKSHEASKRPLLGATNNALIGLIGINAFLFIILYFLNLVYIVSDKYVGEQQFRNEIFNWFVLHPRAGIFFTKPWTAITYMFTNIEPWHFISNMLWLGAFGYILQDLADNKKLFPIYLYGGLAAAVLFLLGVNLIPALQLSQASYAPIYGSIVPVIALAAAATTIAPAYKIFPLIGGGIPLWVLTAVFFLIDAASIKSAPAALAIAHLASSLMGFVFAWQLGKGNDLGAWINNFAEWVINLFNPNKNKVPLKERHFYKADKQPYQVTPNITQQKLDATLDKISQHGYGMLTDDEKEFLKRASKEEL